MTRYRKLKSMFAMLIIAFNLYAFDKSDLLSQEWIITDTIHTTKRKTEGVYIKFEENGDYYLGSKDYKGTYTLKDNALTLSNPKKIKEDYYIDNDYERLVFNIFYKEDRTFYFDEEYKSYDTSCCLRSPFCNYQYHLNSKNPQKEGVECYADLNRSYHYEFGKVIKKSGKLYAVENLKLRQYPDLTSHLCSVNYNLSDFLEKNNLNSEYTFKYNSYVEILLAGYVVKYDAYTVEKSTIDGLTAVWYRIDVPYRSSYDDAWVFGGYIKEYTDDCKEETVQLLLNAGLEKFMIHKNDDNVFQYVYDNIKTLPQKKIIDTASVQKYVEGSRLTQNNSYILKAYEEKRYDLFAPLCRLNYPFVYDIDTDNGSKTVCLYSKMIEDNNIEACKALYKAGYTKTEQVFLDNEFDKYSLRTNLLTLAKKDMLEAFYDMGYDLLSGGSYASEGGEPRCAYSSMYYARNNKHAIDFLISKGLDINDLSYEHYFMRNQYRTLLDYALECQADTVEYIKSKGGMTFFQMCLKGYCKDLVDGFKTDSCKYRINDKDVRFREGPSTASNILGKFEYGEEIYVIGSEPYSKWFFIIRNNNQFGYVYDDYVERVED